MISYVIWLGDLNFRLDDLLVKQIADKLKDAKNTDSTAQHNIFQELLNYDQVSLLSLVITCFKG